MENTNCKICENRYNNKIIKIREMMFGFRDKFDYLECSDCGCIQLLEIPEDLSKYYPDNYYSFNEFNERLFTKKTLKRVLKKLALDHQLGQFSPLGKLLSGVVRNPVPLMSVRSLNLRYDSKILDIGCGTGILLLIMRGLGFRFLTGVDPFIKADINYNCGVRILNRQIDEITEKYDFIMLHHAFEHMDQPLEKLQAIYKMLHHNSYVLIRIPVASSFANRKYKSDWVQLDAPRHFYIHTIQSMSLLCKKAGFILKEVKFDSDEFQFTGSESYLRDIPLRADKSIFDSKTIRSFSKQARILNDINDGDQAQFYLYKE